MPFQSEKQRRFLYAKHPEIAKRWAKEENMEKKPMMKGKMPMKGSGVVSMAAVNRAAMKAKMKRRKASGGRDLQRIG